MVVAPRTGIALMSLVVVSYQPSAVSRQPSAASRESSVVPLVVAVVACCELIALAYVHSLSCKLSHSKTRPIPSQRAVCAFGGKRSEE
jgi:hypothetical protein